MAAITVRNLPPNVERAIHEKARKERLSLNKAVVRLLEEATGAATAVEKPPVHRDLDRFFGTWTATEADAFDQALASQRRVDRKLWR